MSNTPRTSGGRPGSQNIDPPYTAPLQRREFQSEPAPNKSCGDCALCCKLIPVSEIAKPAGRWCNHCTTKRGCDIYPDRPKSCAAWSCIWLSDANLPPSLRPDRCHIVFDCMVEFIEINGEPARALQAWIDPAYPHAYHDPDVMWAIDQAGKHTGMPTLLRYNASAGRLLTPPSLGGWSQSQIFTSTMPEIERERMITAALEKLSP